MKTTIDAAGRMMIPKPLRDAMGMAAGVKLDVKFVDGRIVTEYPAEERTAAVLDDGLPAIRVQTSADAEKLTAEEVRDVLEAVRR